MKSAICLIAKNEAPYLVEWVAHYVALGFDQIVVYENNSTDNTQAVLAPLDKAGVITLKTWTKGATESPQISAYIDALSWMTAEWVLFADADEFLVLHEDDTVNAFLGRFDSTPDITSVVMNWRLFGDSHLMAPDGRLLRERFVWAEAGGNRHLKSFSKREAISGLINMHVCETSGRKVHASGRPLAMTDWGLSDEVDLSVAQINHYYTKTFPEFQEKNRRGHGDVVESDERKYTTYSEALFQGMNKNDIRDLSISVHQRAFDRAYRRISALAKAEKPSFAQALQKFLGLKS